MIIAKPFSIAAGALPAGGSSFNIGGSKFFLLAASEPLFVKLYRGSWLVGDFTGFNGGLEAGPYCAEFTSFSLATQSGNAGNALIGVGDEDMAYNPLAGALNFTNPATNAGASQTPASLTSNAQQSQNGQNFTARDVIPNNAGTYGSIELSYGGIANIKTATITGLVITNSGATAVSVQIGTLASIFDAGLDAPPAYNLQSGGPAAVFNVSGGQSPGLGSAPAFKVLKLVQLAAGQQLLVDLTSAPIVLLKGAVASFMAQCTVANSPISYEVNWSET